MATIFRPPLFNVRREIDPTQTGINAQFGVQFNINLFPPPPPQIPPGENYSARPDPIYWSNTWTQSLVLTTLRSQDKMTVGEQHTERPPPVDWRAGQTLSLVLSTLRGQDAMTVGEQRFELPPTGHIYPQQLRTWLHSYNLNLIGKDRMTVGKQLTDLPPRDHSRTEQTRTWTFTYNPNLVGQDFFPPGRVQHSARPDPVQWYQNWTLSLLQSTLTPVVVNPFGPFDWPLPGIAEQPLRSFSQWFNLNLIGQDFFPPGEQYTDRPPGPDWRNTWTLNLLQSTLTPVVVMPFGPYDWPNPKSPEQPQRSYNFSYNLNLIGQDFFPPGKRIVDLPPRDYSRTEQTRTWLHNYNLNLIGKDRLPTGDQVYDLPPLGYPRQDQQRTWLWNYNLNLIAQDAMVVGKQYTERPPGPDWRNSWTLNLLQTTLIPTVLSPFGPYDWPTPKWPAQPSKSYQQSFNLNLIGKDLLPFRQMDWPNPQQPFYPTTNRSWLSSSIELINRQRPFRQLDWPLPGRFQQPVRSFNHSSLALISLHRPPFTQKDWPLPGRHPEVNRSTFFSSLQLLTAEVVFPVGKQISDLPPTGYFYPASLRFASNSPQVPPPTPPVGGNFEWIIRARRRHRR